jgi:uncharacterized protein (TIGR04168 family)
MVMVNHLDRSCKIAVIGDVHDQWEIEDNLALEALKVDLALFVGDFGNESLEIVHRIASLSLAKAVILGNHDAWYTATPWGRKQCPYDRTREDRVTAQLELLGITHVGYGKLDLPDLAISVVGGRPFTWGGSEWKNQEFFQERYNIKDFAESTAKILANVQEAAHNTLIFLGHNGPLGLGNNAEAICGRDWQPLGGDHGDPDLAAAIQQAQDLGKQVPLVTFGHMHHRLRHTTSRLRTQVVTSKEGTLYLNAASVPRIVNSSTGKLRNFSLVTMTQGQIIAADLVWVDDNFEISTTKELYRSERMSVSG